MTGLNLNTNALVNQFLEKSEVINELNNQTNAFDNDDPRVQQLQEQKVSLQDELESLNEEIEELEIKFENREDEFEDRNALAQDAMIALNDNVRYQSQSAQEEVMARILANPEEAENQDALLSQALDSINVDTSDIDYNVEAARSINYDMLWIANDMQSLNMNSNTVDTQIDNINVQINNINMQNATNHFGQGDITVSSNPTVQGIREFINSQEAQQMSPEEIKGTIKSVFRLDINTNGIPYGHDEEAREVYVELNDMTGGEAERTDPIGFEADGVRYDFISDKNADGIFNGKEEFVGAQDGWKEMLVYDDNKDGIINGKELDDLQVLVKDGNDFQVVSAAQAGIEEIDLNSFQQRNQELDNGNLLAGVFDIDFAGKTVEATQTFDTDAFLNEHYGEAFGMDLNDQMNGDFAVFQELFDATQMADLEELARREKARAKELLAA